MSISQNFPEEGPTLNLNFAGSKALDPRITFSRSSVGTYMDANGLVATASTDSPRFDHRYVNGEIESLGLLVEEQRTNILQQSVVTTSNWGGSTSNTTYSNLSLNALGIFPGVEITTTTGAAWHRISTGFNVPFVSGTKYAVTFYYREGTSGYVRLQFRYNSQESNIQGPADGSSWTLNQNIGSISNVTTTLMDGQSTYKTSYIFTPNFTGNAAMGIGIGIASAGTTVIALGAQVEEGEFPTSYIPTSGSTVTRTEDRAVIEGTNFTDIFDTNFESFSMFVNYDNLGISTGTNHAVVLFWGESLGYDDRIEFFKDNADPYHIETRAFGGGSGVFANGNLSAGSTAATQKLAMSWSVPDYSNTSSRRWAFSFNGESVDVVNDASGSTIPDITRVGFGINPTRTDFHGKRITFKQITLYSKSLTDSQLQNLTK